MTSRKLSKLLKAKSKKKKKKISTSYIKIQK